MTYFGKPGAPLPIMPDTPIHVITETGDFDNRDGCRLYLVGNRIVFASRAGDIESEASVMIEDLLSAIGDFTRKYES